MVEVIGLTGISCTGKTHFTDQLKNKINDKEVISFKSPTYKIIKDFEKKCPQNKNSVLLRQFYLIEKTTDYFFGKIFRILDKNSESDVIAIFDRIPIDYIAYLLTFLEHKRSVVSDAALFNRLYELLKIKYSEQLVSGFIRILDSSPGSSVIFKLIVLTPFKNDNPDYTKFLNQMCRKKDSRVRFLKEFNIEYDPELDIEQFKKFTEKYYGAVMSVLDIVTDKLLKRYSEEELNERFKIKVFADTEEFPFKWQDKVLHEFIIP